MVSFFIFQILIQMGDVIMGENLSCSITNLADWMIATLGEDAIEKFWSTKNNIAPWKIGKNSHKVVWIRCQKNLIHEDYEIPVRNFTRRTIWDECKICNSLGNWMINNLGENSIEEYWSNKNNFSPWDIYKNSNVKIWINCQKTEYHYDYDTTPTIFSRLNHTCPYCVSKRVHPKDSFAQWCIDNVDVLFLKKYWSNKNSLSPWEISRTSNSKIVYINCQIKEYHSCYQTTPSNFASPSNQCRCPYCAGQKTHPKDSFAQWGIDTYGEDFLNKYWDFERNKDLNPWSITKSSGKTIYLKCQTKEYHNAYPVRPYQFVSKNSGCSYCANRKIHPLDSLGSIYPKSLSVWSDINNTSPLEFSPHSNKSVFWKCENGKTRRL